MSDEIVKNKQLVRTKVQKLRAAMTSYDRSRASRQICSSLAEIKTLQQISVIAGFWPTKQEVDIRRFIVNSLCARRAVCLPRVVEKGKSLSWHNMLDEGLILTTGYSGISEPSIDLQSFSPGKIGSMLVPAISVDSHGNRLGMGGGFYDITITNMTNIILIAVVFDCQIVASLPVEAHDKKIDMIVTEKRIIDLRK